MIDQAEFERQVEANFPRNFLANVADIALFMLGFNLVSQTTIMPLLVSHLTTSKIAIGLIPAITNLGYLLPQLLAASYTEGLPRKKMFVFIMGGLERIPYPFIALAVLLLAGPAPQVALAAILVLRAFGTIAGGIATPAWYDLIAKVIPVRSRGLYSGVGNGMGALLGVAGAALSGWILGRWLFPLNFALCFLVAYGFMGVSWFALLLNREPVSPVVKQRVGLGSYLRQLPVVLQRDRNYLHYLVSRAIVMLGGMAGGFYMVYGVERFHLAEAEAGLVTALLVGSQAVLNLLLGPIGDRLGHKRILCGEAACVALAAVSAYLAPSPGWLFVSFVLMGGAIAAGTVSGLNIILEFCHAPDRPTYIGLTNTLLAPFSVLGPILGGVLATWLGYRAMFAVACSVAVIGGLLMAVWVREPRQSTEVDALPAA